MGPLTDPARALDKTQPSKKTSENFTGWVEHSLDRNVEDPEHDGTQNGTCTGIPFAAKTRLDKASKIELGA